MKKTVRHSISALLALVTLCVFAVCILATVLTGANAYTRLAGRDEAAFESRTAARYLTTRLRGADTAGAVAAGSFADRPSADASQNMSGDTLFLEERIDGALYCTRIYCYDGALRELFTDAQADCAPEDGQIVLDAERLYAERSSGRLHCTVVDGSGQTAEIWLCLRSGEAVAP